MIHLVESRPTLQTMVGPQEISCAGDQKLASPVKETVVRWPPATVWFAASYFGHIVGISVEKVIVASSDVEISQHLGLGTDTFYNDDW